MLGEQRRDFSPVDDHDAPPEPMSINNFTPMSKRTGDNNYFFAILWYPIETKGEKWGKHVWDWLAVEFKSQTRRCADDA